MDNLRILIIGFICACANNAFLLQKACAETISKEVKEVIKYAQDPNAKELRALGVFQDFPENNPWASAENFARGELALRVEAYVSSMLHTYRSSNQHQSRQNVENDVRSAANVLLKDVRMVKSAEMKGKDHQIIVYVCAEIDKDNVMNAIQSDSRFLDLDTESIFIE